jgi:uncharacterized protein (TIRG00374 family)
LAAGRLCERERVTKGRAIRLAVQLAVSAVLIGLLAWRIDFRDTVVLRDGQRISGWIAYPDKNASLDRLTDVVLRDGRTFLRAELDPQVNAAVRYGFVTSIRDIDPVWAGLAMLCMGSLAVTTGYRWRLLLRVQGVHFGVWQAIKLTVVGFLFDNVMPGSTGGDVVKSYYVARQSHRKAEAVVSVFVDRFVGLAALAFLTGVAVLVSLQRPEFERAAYIVALFLGALTVGGLVFYSRRIRRLVRLDALLKVLPFQRIVQRCDQAVFIYRYHRRAVLWAILLSLLTQTTMVIGFYCLGRGLGVRGETGLLDLHHYFVYIPVLLMVSSVPATPGGLGWREWAFTLFFGLSQVPAGMACALSIVYWFTRIAWSLPGVLFLWGRQRVSAAQMASELAEP